MPIDPDVAIGARSARSTFSWTESDVLLYHLAHRRRLPPGRQPDPDALRWTTDGASLQVLPSFGVVAPTFHRPTRRRSTCPGCDINLAQVVHGSQSITVHAPLPTSGSATVRTTLTDVWDKGKAAVIWQEGVATSESGEELWTTRSSIFVRGEGGWGGDRGTAEPGRAAGPGARRRDDVRRSRRSRRCSTGSAATATRCTPTPTSPRRPASRRRSCTGSAPTASCCASSPTALLGGDATRVGGFAVEVHRRGLPRRDAPGAGLAGGRPDPRRRPPSPAASGTARPCSATSSLTTLVADEGCHELDETVGVVHPGEVTRALLHHELGAREDRRHLGHHRDRVAGVQRSGEHQHRDVEHREGATGALGSKAPSAPNAIAFSSSRRSSIQVSWARTSSSQRPYMNGEIPAQSRSSAGARLDPAERGRGLGVPRLARRSRAISDRASSRDLDVRGRGRSAPPGPAARPGRGGRTAYA